MTFITWYNFTTKQQECVFLRLLIEKIQLENNWLRCLKTIDKLQLKAGIYYAL